jgi:hypothetical protein
MAIPGGFGVKIGKEAIALAAERGGAAMIRGIEKKYGPEGYKFAKDLISKTTGAKAAKPLASNAGNAATSAASGGGSAIRQKLRDVRRNSGR